MFNRFLYILMGLSILLSACVSNPEAEPSPTPMPAKEATADNTEASGPSSTATPGSNADVSIGEAEAEDLMYLLTNGGPKEAEATLEQILGARDERFISVLLEMLRGAQIGLVRDVEYSKLIDSLEELSGQALGDNWPAWVEWYGKTDLEPPPGFTTWKGSLLERIDPGFAVFLNDDHPSRIRVEEIQWGGVQVDGIPALNNPLMIPAEEAEYLVPGEPVFGIELNGDARAYPLRIMDWHEMANDIVGGVPISLAYCTLCGAGIAFDGRASDGVTYTFGSSGFLFRSNKLMYDRVTNTLWNQLTGEPVLGELADTETRLSILPLVLTSWGAWKEQHPETKVLALETGHSRLYELGAAYGDYFSSEGTMFPVWQRSEELPAKARVFAMHLEGVPKAYALEKLVEEQVVNDVLGETQLVLVAQRGRVEVEGENLRVGAVVYESGGEVRAFDRGNNMFSPGPQADVLLDEDGNQWQVTEGALLGPNGKTAPRLGGHLAYWFGWFAFFPNTLIYE
jgi:hypothetical protein